ncbi:peptidoglycan-recognition protein LC-like isoform X1 [Aricia agestis]|uniref:peptidoglycan-recognition protein LC-like isoform X1 n=1 Tax=Aricia agestis TaxID=91739 RepID=UPI001C201B7C|nr:peptidoglycan-recognition protein LC-like isoform X1 [Aricia agestis]
MALTVNSSTARSENVGAKVSGDIGAIQITEVSDTESDTEQDKHDVSKTVSVPDLPNNLIQKSEVPVFGSVAITNSDNVQFGNNTYFNGPVTIKQVINKSGVDNPAYNKTEAEVASLTKHTANTEKRIQILLWHKVTFSAICISVFGGLLAIILLVQNNHEDDIKILNSPDYTPNVTASPSMVVGYCYDNIHAIIVSVILFPLTFLLIFYLLLTKNAAENGRIIKNEMHDNRVIKTCMHKEADPLIIAPDVLRIVSRTEWLAQPVEKELTKLTLPAPWVIIAHTATESCYTQSQCVLRVRLIQSFHIESRGWDDIAYNYLVGGDGSVYYGRGWDYQGAHTKYYNKFSIGIAFVGTFNNDQPPKQQVEACKKIIKQGVQLGKISKDYKLLAHRQLMSTLSPGDKVMDIIKEWPHFVKNDTDVKDLL